MMGVDVNEQFEPKKELLRLLAKGDREIETCKGYNLNTVLTEADALLTEEPS
jgi:hypothetical protein